MKHNALFLIGISLITPWLLQAEINSASYHRAMIEDLFDSLMPQTDSHATPAEKSVQSYITQAQFLMKNKEIDKAIGLYKQAIAGDPLSQEAHYALGNALLENNQLEDALESFKIVTSLDDNHRDAHLNIAKIYVKKNDNSNAKLHFQMVAALDSTHRESLTELARILCDEQQYEESIRILETLRIRHSDDIAILFQLANTLNTANYNDESLAIYHALHNKHPQSSAITYNIAYTLKKVGRIDDALAFYEKTLALSPEHAEAHFSRGLAYLSIGEFKKGWQEYEWRWKRDTQSMEKRNLSKPLWDGSDLHGKTILLHAEQGLGDTFQFIRYAKVAHDLGATVIAAVQNPLIDILTLCPYIDRVISLTSPLPHFDVHAPLLSMPHIMQTVEETVPCEIPYLYAHTKLVEYWKDTLSSDKNFKIGICWQGNPNYNTPFLRAVVAAKSIKLKQLAPLFTIPGVSVYNLQKTTGEEQLNDLPAGCRLINFDENFDKIHGRFMDTAAVIKNLDLIITVDTGLAHIAAGLGAKVWTFIPNPPDWRWMLDRADTPWYPNMTLFRQPKPGDWDSVIQQITDKLTVMIATRSTFFAQKTLGDIVEMLIKTSVYSIHHSKKSDLDIDIKEVQDEITRRNIDKEIMEKVKEYALELGKVHHEIIQITAEMHKIIDPLSQEYFDLTEQYRQLNTQRERIKNEINKCSN